MKILHIISSGGMYGAEAVILNLSRTLNQGPHRSILGVFSNLSRPNLQLHERALGEGIDSHLIPCNGQIDRSVPAAIRELARQTEADVIHAHGYKADIYVYLAMHSLPNPIVSTCHTWYDNDLVVRLYGALDRFLLRRYSAVVAVSSEVRQRLLDSGVEEDRIRRIRNGIEVNRFTGAKRMRQAEDGAEQSLHVGLVGRLSQEKGVDVFLRAAAAVLSKLPLTRFSVAGDGPDKLKLEALIDDLKIRDSASLIGRTEDVPAFYASLDVLVSSSRQEGLPIALLEGMASGLPLVATSVGSVPDIVRQDRTGLLIAPEDPTSLANAISALLRDSTLRRRYGSAAQTLIEEEYSAARMSVDYLELYDQLAAVRNHSQITPAGASH